MIRKFLFKLLPWRGVRRGLELHYTRHQLASWNRTGRSMKLMFEIEAMSDEEFEKGIR